MQQAKRSRIRRILDNPPLNELISVYGWVKSIRESKSCAFIMLSDGSSMKDLQLVVPKNISVENVATGVALKASGQLVSSQGGGQSCELQVASLLITGGAGSDYPLQKKGHSLEFLREIAHLRPRSNTFAAMFRLRHHVAQKVHQFFSERDFYWVHTPILTASDCEGAGELFQVTTLDLKTLGKGKTLNYADDFFGRQAHLAVSGQLEGEAFSLALRDIYTFGPTFRAENSNTTRHLAEFWMIEPELAFADLEDDMNLAEDFIRFLFKETLASCQPEIEFFEKFYKETSVQRIAELSEAKCSRISYTEAVEILLKEKQKFEFPVGWGLDLQSEHEKFLTDQVFKGPVIVFNYPADIKAFYMRANDDGKTVAAMDLLVPRIGEIIGGAQREDRLERLEAKMKEKGLANPDLDWYLDLRRYGGAPMRVSAWVSNVFFST